MQPPVGRRHHLARELVEHQPVLERIPARQHDLHVQVLLHRPGEVHASVREQLLSEGKRSRVGGQIAVVSTLVEIDEIK